MLVLVLQQGKCSAYDQQVWCFRLGLRVHKVCGVGQVCMGVVVMVVQPGERENQQVWSIWRDLWVNVRLDEACKGVRLDYVCNVMYAM